MTKKKWGIMVNGDRWMSEGHWIDEDGDWHDYRAEYSTAKEAKSDAAEFNKDSSHTYEAKEIK